jgi:hypothetical protein
MFSVARSPMLAQARSGALRRWATGISTQNGYAFRRLGTFAGAARGVVGGSDGCAEHNRSGAVALGQEARLKGMIKVEAHFIRNRLSR